MLLSACSQQAPPSFGGSLPQRHKEKYDACALCPASLLAWVMRWLVFPIWDGNTDESWDMHPYSTQPPGESTQHCAAHCVAHASVLEFYYSLEWRDVWETSWRNTAVMCVFYFLVSNLSTFKLADSHRFSHYYRGNKIISMVFANIYYN